MAEPKNTTVAEYVRKWEAFMKTRRGEGKKQTKDILRYTAIAQAYNGGRVRSTDIVRNFVGGQGTIAAMACQSRIYRLLDDLVKAGLLMKEIQSHKERYYRIPLESPGALFISGIEKDSLFRYVYRLECEKREKIDLQRKFDIAMTILKEHGVPTPRKEVTRRFSESFKAIRHPPMESITPAWLMLGGPLGGGFVNPETFGKLISGPDNREK